MYVGNQYPPTSLQIEGTEEKRRRADLLLLSKLWKLINWEYIDILDANTQSERIHFQTYLDHIDKYSELRNQPQNKFHHLELEKAFSEFDNVLKEFCETLADIYPLSYDGKWLISMKMAARFEGRWLSNDDYAYYSQCKAGLVKLSMTLLDHSRKMVGVVRSIFTDFDFSVK